MIPLIPPNVLSSESVPSMALGATEQNCEKSFLLLGKCKVGNMIFRTKEGVVLDVSGGGTEGA